MHSLHTTSTHRAMAEEDAQASGLDAATLQGHVVSLSQQPSEEMDSLLSARQIQVSALSSGDWLTKARLLAGVVLPVPSTSDRSFAVALATHGATCAADETRVGSRAGAAQPRCDVADAGDVIRQMVNAAADDAAAPGGRHSSGDDCCASGCSASSSPNGWGKVRAQRSALRAVSAIDSAMREGPYETSTLRRQVQH